MTDERFEQQVKAAARRIASRPAPDALRARVASIPIDHPRPVPRGNPFGVGLRMGGALVATLVVVLIAINLPQYRGPAAMPSPGLSAAPTGPTPSATVQPALPQTVRQVALYNVETNLMAAAGGRLYGALTPSSGTSATMLRIAADGSIARLTLSDPLASSYSWLAAHGSSLYLGTSVDKKFTGAADELIRIDGSTLKAVRRTTLPGGVIGLIADSQDVWVGLADRVLRVDPLSLEVKASRIIPGTSGPPAGPRSVNSLALGPDGLMATVGGVGNDMLYRLNAVDLSIVGHTDLPDPGQVTGVVGDGESAWLTGVDWVQRLDPSGTLGARTAAPALQAAVAQGQGMLALVYEASGSEALLEINAQGAVIGRSEVGDAGGRIALDGSDVWLLNGLSLAHWTIVTPQA
jgi:hypothetical protein